MSAWYIFNALGFYPVNPASAEYVIGTPLFDRVDVTFPASPANNHKPHKLTIVAPGARDNIYVQSVSTGKGATNTAHTSPILKHTEVMHIDHLTFQMNDSPQQWSVGVL